MSLFTFCCFFFFSSQVTSAYCGRDTPMIMATADVDIAMKSKLNKSKDKVLVLLELPTSETVGFQLYTRDGDLIFRWNEQLLDAGHHELALPIPPLEASVYSLQMMANDQEVQHLLVIP